MLWGIAGVILVVALANFRLFLLIALVCGTGWGGWAYLNARASRQIDESLAAELDQLASQYREALTIQFRQSCRHDPFGDPDDSRWHRVLSEFLSSKFRRNRENIKSWLASPAGDRARQELDARVRQWVKVQDAMPGSIDAANVTPIEYEQHCAQLLKRSGWNVQLTPVSGDGGADLVARRSGACVIIQCKRYAKPVGNRAVQEAYTAKSLYGGSLACVVAPNGFTKQAEREAYGLGVLLLHHSKLSGLGSESQPSNQNSRSG